MHRDNDQLFSLSIGNKLLKFKFPQISLFSKRIQNLKKFNPSHFNNLSININIDDDSANILKQMISLYKEKFDNMNLIEDLLKQCKNENSKNIILKIGLFLQNHELLLIANNNQTPFQNNEEAIQFIKERKDFDFKYFTNAIDYLAQNKVSPILKHYFQRGEKNDDDQQIKCDEEIDKLISQIYPIRKDLLLLICMSESLNIVDVDLVSFAIDIDKRNLYPDHLFLHYILQKTILIDQDQIDQYEEYTESTYIRPNLKYYLLQMPNQPESKEDILIIESRNIGGLPDNEIVLNRTLHEDNVFVIIESYTVEFDSRYIYYPESWEILIQKDNINDPFQTIHKVDNADSKEYEQYRIINEDKKSVTFKDIPIKDSMKNTVVSYVIIKAKSNKYDKKGNLLPLRFFKFSVNGKKYEL